MPDFSLRRLAGVVCVCLLFVACNRAAPRPENTVPPPGASAPNAAAAPDLSALPRIVVLRASLTAGPGLLETQACPALLQERLQADGYKWEVISAGVSGETSAAGLQRADWALEQGQVRILVLELGANDGLRGLPPEEMKKNLAAIIEKA